MNRQRWVEIRTFRAGEAKLFGSPAYIRIARAKRFRTSDIGDYSHPKGYGRDVVRPCYGHAWFAIGLRLNRGHERAEIHSDLKSHGALYGWDGRIIER